MSCSSVIRRKINGNGNPYESSISSVSEPPFAADFTLCSVVRVVMLEDGQPSVHILDSDLSNQVTMDLGAQAVRCDRTHNHDLRLFWSWLQLKRSSPNTERLTRAIQEFIRGFLGFLSLSQPVKGSLKFVASYPLLWEFSRRPVVGQLVIAKVRACQYTHETWPPAVNGVLDRDAIERQFWLLSWDANSGACSLQQRNDTERVVVRFEIAQILASGLIRLAFDE